MEKFRNVIKNLEIVFQILSKVYAPQQVRYNHLFQRYLCMVRCAEIALLFLQAKWVRGKLYNGQN